MNTLRIEFNQLKNQFERILVKKGMTEDRAKICAQVFAENSRDGVSSHGLNRFPMLVKYIDEGYIQVNARPEKITGAACWEQWDGKLGPGILNALECTDKAITLAKEHGIGCIGLQNTNHWMRGGSYGWRAADAGFAMICWTNTIPNMPPWGAKEPRLGNNPFILAVPGGDHPVVLDMAMTQFSYGKMWTYRERGQILPFEGGFNKNGKPTKNPAEILESGLALPIGRWKGSGLSLLLDLFAVLISGGRSTLGIGKSNVEYGVSQVFIAFDVDRFIGREKMVKIIDEIIDDLHQADPIDKKGSIFFPGERTLKTRQESMEKGVLVDERIWNKVLEM